MNVGIVLSGTGPGFTVSKRGPSRTAAKIQGLVIHIASTGVPSAGMIATTKSAEGGGNVVGNVVKGIVHTTGTPPVVGEPHDRSPETSLVAENVIVDVHCRTGEHPLRKKHIAVVSGVAGDAILDQIRMEVIYPNEQAADDIADDVVINVISLAESVHRVLAGVGTVDHIVVEIRAHARVAVVALSVNGIAGVVAPSSVVDPAVYVHV